MIIATTKVVACVAHKRGKYRLDPKMRAHGFGIESLRKVITILLFYHYYYTA